MDTDGRSKQNLLSAFIRVYLWLFLYFYKNLIPFVFYHGEKSWDLGVEFLNQFACADELWSLSRYIPNFTIELLELERTDVGNQFSSVTLRLYLSLVQGIRWDFEELFSSFLKILSLVSQENSQAKRLAIFRKLMYYLARSRPKEGHRFREKEIYEEMALEGEFMNFIEEIQLEGKQAGIFEGKREGKLETASKMLTKGFSLADILEITGLTESDLKEKGLI